MIINSSSFCEEGTLVFPEIIVLAIVVVNVLSDPPTCPSNIISLAVTSPVRRNVVADVSLSDEPALPLTVPLTLTVKFPINVVA